ncbi:MAG TPA: ABC transporter permease [Pyrinomonadaceae bacterium]|nr:ABC transporter permease [Pyrinomonadaceae bacterium]
MSSNTSDTTEIVPAAPTAARARGGRADAPSPAELPRPRRIRAEEAGVQLNFADLWAYRELLYFLTWRDIKVRYKQTLMGAAWVIVQPLLTMLVFTLVFTRFVKLEEGAVPYPLFAYSGLLLWTFFSVSITSGTTSLITNTSLITKVYFPRAFIPAAAVGAGLVDFCVGALMLVGLAVYYRVQLTWGLLLAPFFVMLAAMLALACGLLTSSLTVKYRDLRHTLPFLLQFWMFASPVIYPMEAVPGRWRWLLALNPLTGVLEGFRSALAGTPFEWGRILVPVVVAPALLALAFYVFRRLEDTFADLI